MGTHTPGPWIVFVDRGSDAAIFTILPAGRNGEIASNIENDDDASLIAAAPDLLAALKQLVADYEDVPDATDEDGQSVFQRARAAIAKAEAHQLDMETP